MTVIAMSGLLNLTEVVLHCGRSAAYLYELKASHCVWFGVRVSPFVLHIRMPSLAPVLTATKPNSTLAYK